MKWRLQLSFVLLHSAAIKLQEAKDCIVEEDPRPTSSNGAYINRYYYIPWGFMSHWKLEWFEDISFYLGMEVPYDAQECNVTLMRFDAKVNVLSWRFELVSPM